MSQSLEALISIGSQVAAPLMISTSEREVLRGEERAVLLEEDKDSETYEVKQSEGPTVRFIWFKNSGGSR